MFRTSTVIFVAIVLLLNGSLTAEQLDANQFAEAREFVPQDAPDDVRKLLESVLSGKRHSGEELHAQALKLGEEKATTVFDVLTEIQGRFPVSSPLRAPPWLAGAAAQSVLQRGGTLATRRLLHALGNAKVDSVRARAALTLRFVDDLGDVEPDELFAGLDAALEDESGEVRTQAAWALARRGERQHMQGVMARLKDEERTVRDAAVYAMGRHRIEHTAPTVLELYEQDRVDHGTAITTLGALQARAAVPTLVKALDEVSHRYYAIIALGNIGDPRATRAIVEQLERQTVNRSDVAKALGRIGDRAAVPTLISMLDDANSGTREHVIEALGKTGDTRSTLPLVERLKVEARHPNLAVDIVRTLGTLNDPRAVEPLVRLYFELPQKADGNRIAAAIRRALVEIKHARTPRIVVDAWTAEEQDRRGKLLLKDLTGETGSRTAWKSWRKEQGHR